MKAAPPGVAGPKAKKQCSESHYGAFRFLPQATLTDRIRRLSHLRRELDRWWAAGRRGPMPQPRAFGLRLPPLEPCEVLWAEGRL